MLKLGACHRIALFFHCNYLSSEQFAAHFVNECLPRTDTPPLQKAICHQEQELNRGSAIRGAVFPSCHRATRCCQAVPASTMLLFYIAFCRQQAALLCYLSMAKNATRSSSLDTIPPLRKALAGVTRLRQDKRVKASCAIQALRM